MIEKYYFYSFITQLFSSCLFLLYLQKKIKLTFGIKFEIFLMVFKLLKEIKYNIFNYELAIHHFIMINACLLSLTDKYKPYRFLILHYQIIHFPLMFNNLKKITKNKYYKNIFQNLYLINWIIFAFYRNLLGMFYSYKTKSKFILISGFCMLFLDLLWTPWSSYKKKIKFISIL